MYFQCEIPEWSFCDYKGKLFQIEENYKFSLSAVDAMNIIKNRQNETAIRVDFWDWPYLVPVDVIRILDWRD